MWITTHDKGLPHAESVSYTVQSGDSTTVIATALKNAINGNSTLTALGVTATSSAAVITISSNSIKATTYTATKNSGATETITLSDSAAASGTVSSSNEFVASPSLSSGANTAVVTAVSGGGTPSNNPYAVTISSVSAQSMTYDDNGNMTGDGTNTYAWDAENRLLQITYPGSGNNTQFVYDPFGRCVKIVETVASSVTSTKQFRWCGAQRCEERDGSGSLSNGKQFFALGQVNFASGTPTNYFYTTDHPGSIREMTKTVSGTTTIEAQYGYDPYGIATKLQGSQDADFQYAGYYMHAPSGLNLTRTRQYSANLGRWISRDPIGENGGLNLYGYVGNSPVMNTDPSGLFDPTSWAAVGGAAAGGGEAGALGGIPGAVLGAAVGVAVATVIILSASHGDHFKKTQEWVDRTTEAYIKEHSPQAQPWVGGGSDNPCKRVYRQALEHCSDRSLPTQTNCGSPFYRCVDQFLSDNGCGHIQPTDFSRGRWNNDFTRWVPNR